MLIVTKRYTERRQMRLRTKAQKLVEILETVDDSVDVPTSALKSLRGSRHQLEIARASGVSQGHISEIEAGKKALTPAVAAKLAPTLGCTPDALMTAHRVASLQKMALKGVLDPEPLFRAVQDLAWSLPDSDLSDSLIEVLLGVLKEAMEHYDEHERAVARVSTKSGAPGRTRDGLGRRLGKPHQARA
jgi:transcriptional regulator with XRE-family HTH domain